MLFDPTSSNINLPKYPGRWCWWYRHWCHRNCLEDSERVQARSKLIAVLCGYLDVWRRTRKFFLNRSKPLWDYVAGRSWQSRSYIRSPLQQNLKSHSAGGVPGPATPKYPQRKRGVRPAPAPLSPFRADHFRCCLQVVLQGCCQSAFALLMISSYWFCSIFELDQSFWA